MWESTRSLQVFLKCNKKYWVNDHTCDKSGLKRTATSETPEGVDEVLTSKKPKKKKVKVEEQEELSEIGKKQFSKNTSSVSTTESETRSKKKKIK